MCLGWGVAGGTDAVEVDAIWTPRSTSATKLCESSGHQQKLLFIPVPFLQEEVQTTLLNVVSEAPYILGLLSFLTVDSEI